MLILLFVGALRIAQNPTLLSLADKVLTYRTTHWWGDKQKVFVTKPTINLTLGLEIHPGAKAQALHRDSCIYNQLLPEVDAFHDQREFSMLTFTACSRVTPENGGVSSLFPVHRSSILSHNC